MPQTDSYTKPGDRLPALDSLRGLAALGVVLWHYGAHFDAQPMRWLFMPAYNAGFFLVDFFFVLSGYVLTKAYLTPVRRRSAGRNIALRIARLYPLHLAMLIVTAALLGLLGDAQVPPSFELGVNDARHFVLNLMMLNQTGLQDGWSFNTPSWSISTEFVINVAFLLLISLSLKSRVYVAIVLLAAFAFWRLAIYPVGGKPGMIMGLLDPNLARCAIGFFAGVLLHILLNRVDLARILRSTHALASIPLIVGIALFTVLLVSSHRHPPNWHYIVSVGLSAGCVAAATFDSPATRLLAMRPLVALGTISYSVYLTHYPLQLLLLIVAGRIPVDFASTSTLLIYLAAVIATSVVTYRLLEKPALRCIRDRFPPPSKLEADSTPSFERHPTQKS